MNTVRLIMKGSTPLGDLPIHIVWAYTGAICRRCNIAGNMCGCWQDFQWAPYTWYNEMYYLGIDCDHCTRGKDRSECTCYRVHSMTHCATCNTEVLPDKWNLIKSECRFVRYCSWVCVLMTYRFS